MREEREGEEGEKGKRTGRRIGEWQREEGRMDWEERDAGSKEK